ncbi:MAG: M24 family metallopeptidase [Mangrovibacterium sp.]
MNKEITQRLALLRKEMQKINANAFYFSGTDPHHSEYLADHWKSIPYFSGFTGSAATLIVTHENAALWTDSRYFIQAEEELKGTGIELQKLHVDAETHAEWLCNELDEGQVATDLSCLMVQEYNQFVEDWDETDDEMEFSLPFRFIDGMNCLNQAWKNRPALPSNPIIEHEDQFCGTSRTQKIAAIKEHYTFDSSSFGIFLTSLDEVAWTFNLRGSDIAYNPVFLAYALIDTDQTVLFVQKGCLSKTLETKLRNEGIDIGDYNDPKQLYNSFLSINADSQSCPVSFDPYISTRISFSTNTDFDEKIDLLIDPMFSIEYHDSLVKSMKAIKETCELAYIQNAMRRDGVAMVKFLYWLHQNIGKETTRNEYELVEVLDKFRAEQEGFMGNSFYPIMSFNANGAIVHRAVTRESAINIEGDGLLLFDSGGQYPDGTTDITRTVGVGSPSEEAKRDFTLVLKGMIALSCVKFPEGTPGCNLDVLARQALWQHGLNYGHGTGHGIGYFLNVHEGPQSIRQQYNPVALQPGMVLSNEPGLYKEGKYGIRIENAMAVVLDKRSEFGQFLSFQTLTLCPIDKQLIDISLLNASEISWLNAYHQRCFKELSNGLSADEKIYLGELTSEI